MQEIVVPGHVRPATAFVGAQTFRRQGAQPRVHVGGAVRQRRARQRPYTVSAGIERRQVLEMRPVIDELAVQGLRALRREVLGEMVLVGDDQVPLPRQKLRHDLRIGERRPTDNHDGGVNRLLAVGDLNGAFKCRPVREPALPDAASAGGRDDQNVGRHDIIGRHYSGSGLSAPGFVREQCILARGKKCGT